MRYQYYWYKFLSLFYQSLVQNISMAQVHENKQNTLIYLGKTERITFLFLLNKIKRQQDSCLSQKQGLISYYTLPRLGLDSKHCSFSQTPDSPCDLTRHDGLLAVEALGGALIRIALRAQQALILGNKRLFHQSVITFGTVEASLVPVPAFVTKILRDSE